MLNHFVAYCMSGTRITGECDFILDLGLASHPREQHVSRQDMNRTDIGEKPQGSLGLLEIHVSGREGQTCRPQGPGRGQVMDRTCAPHEAFTLHTVVTRSQNGFD